MDIVDDKDGRSAIRLLFGLNGRQAACCALGAIDSSTKPAASTSSRTDAASIRCSDWVSLVPDPAVRRRHGLR